MRKYYTQYKLEGVGDGDGAGGSTGEGGGDGVCPDPGK